jgi:hypothetical protein
MHPDTGSFRRKIKNEENDAAFQEEIKKRESN